jgi:stage II sporulation protein D
MRPYLPFLLCACALTACRHAPPPVAADVAPPVVPTRSLWPAEPAIRVLLVDSVPSITGVARDPCRLEEPNGTVVARLAAGTRFTLAVEDGCVRWRIPSGAGGRCDSLRVVPDRPEGVLRIEAVPYGVGWWWAGTQDRDYQGRLVAHPRADGRLELVLTLPLEDYLLGVVPSEIGPTAPLEAQRAQAVAARSEALQALVSRKYAGPHHDIGSDVASQAFTGITKRTVASDEAVRSTRGLILAFAGQPVSGYYASNCGGHSEDIRNVWPHRAGETAYWDLAGFDHAEPLAYDLTREEDLRRWLADSPPAHCNPRTSPVPDWARANFRWERRVDAGWLSAALARHRDIGAVTAIRALRRGPSGRLIEAEFVGTKGALALGPELAIRQLFDPPLKSAAFVVDLEGPAERPAAFVLRGAGWGHGVGLCQTGAIVLAQRGVGFREILRHYYRSAALEPAYPE